MQVRQDMAFVVASLNQGSSSDTIIDLQAKVKELEQMLEDCRADCDEELAALQVKTKLFLELCLLLKMYFIISFFFI